MILLGGLWIASIAGASVLLAREEFTPAKPGIQKEQFPAGSDVPLSSHLPTLILFVHPLCPCTRATFHELDELLAEVPAQVGVVIVFTVPEGLPNDWKQGDLYRSARAMPRIQVLEDKEGTESRRFGVMGSGHCLLYAPSGALLFSGGITASRGHDGESPGRLALADFIKTGHAAVSRTPVFGCSLL